jgi:sulfur-oxidizing protein SoxA
MLSSRAHIDGAYALDAGKRAQWLEMEDFPPYEITVDDGADLYDEPLPTAAATRTVSARTRRWSSSTTRFDLESAAVVTLEQTINACRVAAGNEAWDYLGPQMNAH